MKKIILILLACSMLAMAGCSKSNDSTDMSLAEVLGQGDWYVHYFVDGGNDKTNDIKDYTFSFNSANALDAVKTGVAPTNGFWNAFTDSGKEKLEILWSSLGSTPAILADIEQDWVVTSKSSSLIEFEDDNGSVKEVLHFRKK